MAHHVFDIKERATHSLVADQLRDLADQVATGSLEIANEEWHPPTVIVDPVDVTIDLLQHRNEVEFTIRMRWPTVKDR